jgi:integrase/recombinase XerD
VIETIYKKKSNLVEFRRSPFISEIEELISKYLDSGYHPKMIQGSCSGLLAFIRWAAHVGITPKKLRSSHIDKFLASDSFILKKSGLKSFLNSFWAIIENKYGHTLITKIVPHYQRNPAVNYHVKTFELYMKNAKGLTETSRRRYKTTIGQFLTYIFPQGKVNLNKIKPADILNFLKKRGEKFRNKTVRCDGSAIKCYIRYLYGKGEIKKDLSTVVPVITSWRNQNVIHTVDKNDMVKILMSCDLDTAIGVRDYSVLLLFCVLSTR